MALRKNPQPKINPGRPPEPVGALGFPREAPTRAEWLETLETLETPETLETLETLEIPRPLWPRRAEMLETLEILACVLY